MRVFLWCMQANGLCKWLAGVVFLVGLAGPVPLASAQNINLGLRIIPQFNGLQNAEVNQNALERPELSYGFSAGAAINARILRHLGVEFDILYALQGQSYLIKPSLGSSIPSSNNNLYQSYDVSLTYLKFPLLLNYFTREVDGIAYRLYAGPEVLLKLGTTEKLDGKLLTYTGEGITSSDKFQGQDIAVVAGGGVDFRLGRKLVLNTGIRGEFGLLDVEKKKLSYTPNGPIARSYYDDYYGPGKPRHAPSHLWTFGLLVGVSYSIENVRDPKDYNW